MIDLIDRVEMGANELSQATEYAYIAMSANADYASEYAAGMLAALSLLAQKLQSDVEELSREIRKLRASYNTESGSSPQPPTNSFQQKPETTIEDRRNALEHGLNLHNQLELALDQHRKPQTGLTDKELLGEAVRSRWEEQGIL
ncbi:hypothetical protein C1878_02020 [Gordonibacter sp. 28C]|nr:hypothetical protein C1878_02020 [Gordonibacter sp. 28C]